MKRTLALLAAVILAVAGDVSWRSTPTTPRPGSVVAADPTSHPQETR